MDIGGTDIVFRWLAAPQQVAFRRFVEEYTKLWPNAYYSVIYRAPDSPREDETCKDFTNAADIDYANAVEIILVRDKATSDKIDEVGVTDELGDSFVHALSYQPHTFTVAIHHFPSLEVKEIVERLQKELCD